MSKAYDNLQKLERNTYNRWLDTTRRIDQLRRDLRKAKLSDVPEVKALLEMSIDAADTAFKEWGVACSVLDEIESSFHRGNGEG